MLIDGPPNVHKLIIRNKMKKAAELFNLLLIPD